jgi:hypothetical protein
VASIIVNAGLFYRAKFKEFCENCQDSAKEVHPTLRREFKWTKTAYPEK